MARYKVNQKVEVSGMRRFGWSALSMAVVFIMWVTAFHPDWVIVLPPLSPTAYADSGKCYSSCTNPNRPSYDLWGNEFDAYGNLIKAAPCTTDPISKQPNPISCKVQEPAAIDQPSLDNLTPFYGK